MPTITARSLKVTLVLEPASLLTVAVPEGQMSANDPDAVRAGLAAIADALDAMRTMA